MKIELPVSVPDNIKESWEGQFNIFSWYYFAIDLPTPIFIVTTLKENGLANAQLNTWGMMVGGSDEPKFILQVHNHTETRKLIEKTGEFVVNFPSMPYRKEFMKTIGRFDDITDEITASGFSHEKSMVINTPRVKECFSHFECKLDWIRDIETKSKLNSLVQASIVHAAIGEEVLCDDIKVSCTRRNWVYNVHEMLNPKTGNHRQGFLTTLDVTE